MIRRTRNLGTASSVDRSLEDLWNFVKTIVVWPPSYFVAGRTDNRCYRDPMRAVIPINSSAKAEATTSSDVPVEELVAFERMLADLSARFANVPPERVEIEIQAAQIMLRQFLGFDRSTFGEFQDDGALVVLSSTAVEGFEPTPSGQLPAQLTWFVGQLSAGETVVTPNAAVDLPPEAAAEAEYCRRTGLVSHLAIPLRIGGRIV
jgi:GAF domain-containing protein